MAMVFVPSPTAIHKLFSQMIPFPRTENKLVPKPVQFIPSGDVAIVLVPSPTAAHKSN
jgi:hypothetical protein